MKLPVVNTDEYIIYLENVGGSTFVHCDVFKWSKTVRADLISKWNNLCWLHNKPIYAYHYVGDDKHLKFLKMTGFKPMTSGLANDLRQVEIYVKEISHGD